MFWTTGTIWTAPIWTDGPAVLRHLDYDHLDYTKTFEHMEVPLKNDHLPYFESIVCCAKVALCPPGPHPLGGQCVFQQNVAKPGECHQFQGQELDVGCQDVATLSPSPNGGRPIGG